MDNLREILDSKRDPDTYIALVLGNKPLLEAAGLVDDMFTSAFLQRSVEEFTARSHACKEYSGACAKRPSVADTIAIVLKAFDHPFLLVGTTAHRWMGSDGLQQFGIDLVIRDVQFGAVVRALENGGFWKYYDVQKAIDELDIESDKSPQSMTEHPDTCSFQLDREADAVLRLPLEGDHFEYLRLWRETTYGIDVDGCERIEIPEICLLNSMLAEHDYNPARNQSADWQYGPKLLTKENYQHIYGKIRPRRAPKLLPITIPRVPMYLDALVHHKTSFADSKPMLHYHAWWQIRNLARYLYLELPHQEQLVLFEVQDKTHRYLQDYLSKFVRKPRFVLTRTGEMVRVKEWDRSSYPKNTFRTESNGDNSNTTGKIDLGL